MNGNRALKAIATHLQCSAEHRIDLIDLARALRDGHTDHLDPNTAALISSLFSEIEPSLICAAAIESGGDVFTGMRLHDWLAERGATPAINWQQQTEHFR